jgi:D-beta-D-heptose 7-phosphate kinase / D-beta-D-heptose 1-phosphate adenosyltransferase
MITNFNNANILVVGDAMLDQYYFGKVGRISPEAPVPVVHVQSQQFRLGGAANVAANVSHLRAKVHLVAIAGQDENKNKLLQALQDLSIESNLVLSNTPTITKARVIAESQQMLRLDFEQAVPAGSQLCESLVQHCTTTLRAMSKANATSTTANSASQGVAIISDYGKGLCTASFCKQFIDEANACGIPVLVDPKTTNWQRYSGAFLVTPNFKEFGEVLQISNLLNTDETIEQYAPELMKQFGLQNLLVTRSEKGMSLATRTSDGIVFKHIHTRAREVFDVSGAGDTVIATLAAALSAGQPLTHAVELANIAAGIVVGKTGTAPIEYAELEQAVSGVIPLQKLVPINTLQTTIQELQQSGKKVIFTNGCFDILHRGHVDYLQRARALGDALVVGLNSDASVKRLKGDSRPIHAEQDRAFVLAGLECIDYLCVFTEDTPAQLLSALRPDVIVKGGDYTPDQVVGREFAKEVQILSFVDGFSTTGIIEKSSTSMDS